MLSTVSGIDISISPLQLYSMPLLIALSPDGRLIVSIPKQKLNAPSPISVTESGTTIPVKFSHP